ncbi:ATP-dependent RNA helicase A [Amyelois transitella]|uniref:ATP-dependent RNA helicase A n=1 Tax=Amyelois transitella TaxID=680683 RepID=UPI002990823A|nr:ATP-dependent RNA helicase A [Amyelois transitella]
MMRSTLLIVAIWIPVSIVFASRDIRSQGSNGWHASGAYNGGDFSNTGTAAHSRSQGGWDAGLGRSIGYGYGGIWGGFSSSNAGRSAGDRRLSGSNSWASNGINSNNYRSNGGLRGNSGWDLGSNGLDNDVTSKCWKSSW